jgi:uncharacterized protein YdhG (YjbR/CyaY superfamily)
MEVDAPQLATIDPYQSGGKNCGYDLDRGSFQGLDKARVIAKLSKKVLESIVI